PQGVTGRDLDNLYSLGSSDAKSTKDLADKSRSFELIQDQRKLVEPADEALDILAAAFCGLPTDRADEALQLLDLSANSPASKWLKDWLRRNLYRPSQPQAEAAHAPQVAQQQRPSPAPEAADRTRLEPLPDNIVLAILVATRNAEALPQAQVAAYLRSRVIPAMRRFVHEGEEPKHVINLMLMPARGRLSLKWTPHRVNALLRLAAYLETQRMRTEGYYATYAQLAAFLAGEVRPRFLPAVAAIYHRVLIHPPAETGTQVMAKAANNLTARIAGGLREAFGGTDVELLRRAPTPTLQAVNRIHTLAAVCAAAGADEVPAESLRRVRALFERVPGLTLPKDDREAARHLAVLAMMTNVLIAWRCPYPNFFPEDVPERLDDQVLAPLLLGGALVRIAWVDKDERHEIGQTLANLSNVAAKIGQERIDGTLAAAVLAGMGLGLIAHMAADERQALLDFRGLALAERLLARLDDLSQEILARLKGLTSVLAWLAKAAQVLGVEADISNLLKLPSLANLPKADPPATREEFATALAALTTDLLLDFSHASDPGEAPRPQPQEAASLSDVAVYVFRTLAGAEAFERSAEIGRRLVDHVVTAAATDSSVTEAWEKLYGPEGELEGETTVRYAWAGSDNLRPGKVGPLAALKDADGKNIFPKEDWEASYQLIKTDHAADPIQAVEDLLAEETEWPAARP
ncbi:MAG: hypothetical protein NZ890_03825, partial [Myxococcota bacterium]|nr:hypothetical protein [Myxococcota bacterium]